MVNGLHLYSAFLTSGHSKCFTILPNIHPFMHTDGGVSKAPASCSRAVMVRCLSQGHLDTQPGGAGDQTSNLPVPIQTTLPPEPHAAYSTLSAHLFSHPPLLVTFNPTRAEPGGGACGV